MGRHHSVEDQFWSEVVVDAAQDKVLVEYIQRVIFDPASVTESEVLGVPEYLQLCYGLDVNDQESVVALCRERIMAKYFTIQQP